MMLFVCYMHVVDIEQKENIVIYTTFMCIHYMITVNLVDYIACAKHKLS